MAPHESSPYRVDPTGHAKQQMTAFAYKAAAGTQRQQVVAALRAIFQHLETRPLEWGDPLYHTRLEGGLVCRGLEEPLIAHYAVFESRKLVWLLDVRAVPSSPLAE